MRIFLQIGLIVGLVAQADGYSVLTHEAVIDATWKDHIVPLLLARFGAASPDDLRKAHAYAYGGAIIQDMGYYPLGSKFFSDLTHYVRSADFILNLISEARDRNEYAFALGSLAHYASDNDGHREAVNKSIAIAYPKLGRRFGPVITYADDKKSHIKVEFSFDVAEVAQGMYAPQAYHDFVGFEVAQESLERAFEKTYCLELGSLMNEDVAIGTYRYAVSSVLPAMTKAAWSLKKDEIEKAQPGITKQKFLYNMSRASYHKSWGTKYRRPGFIARTIAFCVRILPKVGPLSALAFHPANAATEKLFMQSVNDALDHYRRMLALHKQGRLKPENSNFDTGEPVKPGQYTLADATYAKLVDKLEGKSVQPDLRADILQFYANLDAPFQTKRSGKAWKKLLEQLAAMRGQGAESTRR